MIRKRIRLPATLSSAFLLILVPALTLAEPTEALWLSRIQLRDCLPGTLEDPRFICTGSGVNTLNLKSDYDTATTGETQYGVFRNLETYSLMSAGFTGASSAPAVSGYAWTANRKRSGNGKVSTNCLTATSGNT